MTPATARERTVSRERTSFLGKMLVAIGDAAVDDATISFAIELATRTGSGLEFCKVFDRIESLALVRNRAASAGVEATSAMLEGAPADAIVARSREGAFDAIVIGASHESRVECALRGSVTNGVLRASVVPVFVVPTLPETGKADGKTILVAVDDSDPSDVAITFAITYASVIRARLIFCTVSDAAAIIDEAQYLGTDLGATLAELHASANDIVGKASAHAAARNVPFDSVVTCGPPAKTILRVAMSKDADSIIMGTHGRRGVRRFFLGSVAEAVLDRATVPVAIVRGKG